ncbi:MAG: glucosaminidase domain-containing protein [Clostridium sp.]
MWKKILLGLLVIFGVAFLFIYNFTKYNELNLNSLDSRNYITLADKAGEGNLQLNWTYIAAINAAQNNNNFKEVSSSDMEHVALMFINKLEENWTAYTFNEVIESLELSGKIKKRALRYLTDLENYVSVDNDRILSLEQKKFIKDVTPGAIKNYSNYGILPSITIAQAILESDWGRSNLSIEAKNIFGIKADSNYQGDIVTFETTEFYGEKIKDNFRKYEDVSLSMEDHAKFLKENERYTYNGVFDSKTYTTQAEALEKAGYSTSQNENGDKIYAETLIDVVKSYNLQLIDSRVIENRK